jgi:DNA-binding SARP family transcriptional activator/pimeloyl-ACP methyl ester carboxylesterase
LVGIVVRVLGPLQVVVDGVDVTPAAPKERALLALLALNARQIVSADRIIEELWPTLDAGRARHALQVRVAELRKLLRHDDDVSRLNFVSGGYRLDVFPEELDEQRFLILVEHGRSLRRADDVFAAAATFRRAIGQWRGDPLVDVPVGPWLEAEAARLSEARLAAVEDCIDAELACGYHQALTFELERLTVDHPLRERFWAQRALALYRCGRQSESLRTCNAARRLFADHIGIEPGPELREVERAVLEQRSELDWTAPRTDRRLPLGADEQPPVRYARAPGGVSIAYQVAGEGPVDLIIIPGFTSHLDIWWEAWSGRMARRLMTFCRLIVFDKRGTGLSDRPPRSGIEHWMEDARVVLDAVGSEQAVVLGMSAGGTVGVLFAATHPERTRALILYGAEPCYLRDDDCSWGQDPSDIESTLDHVREKWGTGVWFDAFCPSANNDPVLRAHYARFQRASASPGAAASYLDSLLRMDVRPALSLVSAPTLILHATRDRTDPVEAARYMAARIPNAKLVELDSADHLIWLTDALDIMVNEIQDFVVGAVPSHDVARQLATVLCVDVPPGPLADDATRQIRRHRGTIVNHCDGLFATFDGPARAIRCATRIVEAGAPARAGLHCAECEVTGEEVRGAAVSIAHHLARQAPAGHVVVTRTVRDLVFGSEITFADHGEIDGLPGDWNAYLVVDT